MSTATGPLSDAEVQLLNDFLLSASEPDDALAIDELHGYLTPVVCCPEAVMPTDWLVGVWRAEGEGPQFESV